MRRFFSLLIASLSLILGLSSCLVKESPDHGVTTNRLIYHTNQLQHYLNDDIAPYFVKLLAVDSYEALPEAEKTNPIYSAFKVTRVYDDGYKYYSAYGKILTDSKRLAEDSSCWAVENLIFLCSTDNGVPRWSFNFVSKYSDLDTTYEPGTCHLWLEDNGNTIRYEFTAKGRSSQGFSSILYTVEPVKYDIAKGTRHGKYRYETYDKDGKVLDWVDIDEVSSNSSYTTSRD